MLSYQLPLLFPTKRENLFMTTNTPSSENATQHCLNTVQTALEDLKAKNIKILNVHELTEVMDYIVIADATSKRHVKALADNVTVEVKKEGFIPLGREGDRDSDWTLVDIGAVVVHVMTPQAREFYDLEGLWSSPEELAKLAKKRTD